MGKQTGVVTFENSLAVSYKIKCVLTIWSRSPILYYLPKWATTKRAVQRDTLKMI